MYSRGLTKSGIMRSQEYILKFHDTDIREVPVPLGIVQPISHHELIRNGEAGVIDLHLFLHPALRLVKKCAETDALRPSLSEDLDQIGKSSPGVDNIFHNQDFLALQGFVQILHDTDYPAGFGIVAVAGHGHKVQTDRNRQPLGQLAGEEYASLEHADQMNCPSFIVLADLCGYLADPPVYLFFCQQDTYPLCHPFLLRSNPPAILPACRQ